MSECVVRMKLPEHCFNCSMKVDPETRMCLLDGHLFEETFGRITSRRDENCPIICALPENHGRLVDADAMADDVRILWDYKTVDGITASTVLKQIMTDIGNCPTIVPAERSET